MVRQQCAACDIHPVNLHGDLSILALVHALDYVQAVHQTYATSTTSLVNLSLGTYIYDDPCMPVSAPSIRRVSPSSPRLGTTIPQTFLSCGLSRGFGRLFQHASHPRQSRLFEFWSLGESVPPAYSTSPAPYNRRHRQRDVFCQPHGRWHAWPILLDAPCASPRAGLRALRRTADPPAENQPALGRVLNSTTAGQYLRSLYTCQIPPGMWQRRLARMQRLGTGVATYVGLVAYFFVSIFAVPFLLAFIIDKLEQRAAQRQAEAMQRAYAGSPDYRQQRLLALKHTFMRTHKVRRRERAELAALLHALHLYGEPRWWCDAAARALRRRLEHHRRPPAV